MEKPEVYDLDGGTPEATTEAMRIVRKIINCLNNEREIQAIMFGITYVDGDDSEENPKSSFIGFGVDSDIELIILNFVQRLMQAGAL